MGILQRTIGQETASQAALRNCSNEEPEYTGSFAGKKTYSQISKDYLQFQKPDICS